MANPTLLTSPIAENGDKNVIPATTGATTGLLDQEHGFQQINELPLQAGGLPPQRKDFNGAFNLLSKILFYAQKGYVFEYDENQDYYAGCVVKDTDGGLYCANTDVLASSTHPKDDPTNWGLINYGINKKETFTSSGTFTAPVTGVYHITLRGGGGGGGGASAYGSGNGGGGGGTLSFYAKLTAGTSYPFTIGAGGAGGAVGGDGGTGGATSITIGADTYTGGGGIYARSPANNDYRQYGAGGYTYINGTPVSNDIAGDMCMYNTSFTYVKGAKGGGLGGGGASNAAGSAGLLGGGGQGGGRQAGTNYAGGAGGDGYIQFEYCDL